MLVPYNIKLFTNACLSNPSVERDISKYSRSFSPEMQHGVYDSKFGDSANELTAAHKWGRFMMSQLSTQGEAIKRNKIIVCFNYQYQNIEIISKKSWFNLLS